MRHVSWKGLPRVMVMTLALDKRDQEILCEQITEAARGELPGIGGASSWAAATLKVKDGHEFSAPLLARIFAAILELEQPERAAWRTSGRRRGCQGSRSPMSNVERQKQRARVA